MGLKTINSPTESKKNTEREKQIKRKWNKTKKWKIVLRQRNKFCKRINDSEKEVVKQDTVVANVAQKARMFFFFCF